MDIDALALRMLALRQPVAYDLRLLTGVTVSRRTWSASATRRSTSPSAHRPTPLPRRQRAEGDLRAMAELAQQMLREGLEAFASGEDQRADQGSCFETEP